MCGSYLRASEKTLQSQGFEEIILQGVGLAWFCNERFFDPEGKKISRKGHLIDDSNKYRFIYVPHTISSKKKKFLMCAKVLIFFAQKRFTSRSYGESRKSERFHVCFVNAHLLYSIIYFAKLHNVFIRPHLLISRSSSKRCRKFFTHQYSTR